MKRFLILIASLFVAQAALAQTPDVTVRIYWLQSIRELKLSVQNGELQVRFCATCPATHVNQSIAVRAAGGKVQFGEGSAPQEEAEVLSAYRVDVPGHPSIAAAYPLAIRAQEGRLLLTLRVPLEEYVAAVLAGESSSFVAPESLKAMAVAARTYAVHFLGRHQPQGFDFCDTTHCQDFRLGAVSERLRQIARATAGELLWYNGAPALTYYHRHCGGTTEDAERVWPGTHAPYLKQHADGYCVARDRGAWHSEISKMDLQRAVANAELNVPERIDAVEVLTRTPSGRVARVGLKGSKMLALSAEMFRMAVGRELGWDKIRSDLYEVRDVGDRFVFSGYGAGHGVGLCQTGAARMGEQGMRYSEILRFYYPGTKLGKAAPEPDWHALGGEHVEVLSTHPEQDEFLVGLAERLMRESEESTGWQFRAQPQIKVFPTLDAYRNATGKPGWMAAHTKGRVIRMQPVTKLRDAGRLEETLRHELLHVLVESRAKASLPLWFREGLVLALSWPAAASGQQTPENLAEIEGALLAVRSQEEMQRAYRGAQAHVEALIVKYGRATVLGWVERGLPAELAGSSVR